MHVAITLQITVIYDVKMLSRYEEPQITIMTFISFKRM